MPSISRRMRTREPTYLSVGFGDFFAIIWMNRNVKLEEKRPDQKWRNKDKLRQGKVHRSAIGLSLKRRRCFVRWYLTINSLLPASAGIPQRLYPHGVVAKLRRHENRIAAFG